MSDYYEVIFARTLLETTIVAVSADSTDDAEERAWKEIGLNGNGVAWMRHKRTSDPEVQDCYLSGSYDQPHAESVVAGTGVNHED